MSEMVERVARAMRKHWYGYQIVGQLGGDLYVVAKAGGEPLAGPFKTMEEAEFGRDCVIARAAIEALRDPTFEMIDAAMRQAGDTLDAWEVMIDAALEKDA